MLEKSRKRKQLEQALEEDPADAFLRYALALACLHDGDLAAGRSGLRQLIADDPAGQVAAYQQLGQSYAETGEADAARAILSEGIARAKAASQWHAAAEMEQIIDSLQ
jgi:predicted Zn-dependent protease